jgi:hypothetical protein
MNRFEFGLAAPADEPGLRELSRAASMQGTIRMAFDRAPDYFASLRPEGRRTEVLVCREIASGRVMEVIHRSIRPMWVNGAVTPVGYLSGLRLSPEVQRGMLLARGNKFLRELHSDRQTEFYLCTIIEDNRLALAQLQSGRCGLPHMHDLGRFCGMAVGMRPVSRRVSGQFQLRPATPADLSELVAFLRREGPKRQFFPVYAPEDFCRNDSLLPGLAWEDIILAWEGAELIGTAAAWDQRSFCRWLVAGYAPWLRALRPLLNAVATCWGYPPLPAPGVVPNYFMLSLVCIRDHDTRVFQALLDEIMVRRRDRFDFLFAGLHERDPLMPELQARRHISMPSRLLAAAWDDGAESIRQLRPELVPYLEIAAS